MDTLNPKEHNENLNFGIAQAIMKGRSPQNGDEDKARLQGQGLYRLAKIYYDKAAIDKAETYFLKALDLLDGPQDSFFLFKIYGFLIRIYSETLREEQAQVTIERSQELLDKMPQFLGTLNSEYFYNLGSVELYKSQFSAAIEHFKLAIEKSKQENNPELGAKSLYSLATCAFHRNDLEGALKFCHELDELLLILKKGYLKSSMYILFGNINRELGQHRQAIESYDNAIRSLKKKTCWNLYAIVLHNKGIALKNSGEFSKALIYFQLALDTVDQTKFKRLAQMIQEQVQEVTDERVDIYLDRHNRLIQEKGLGTIDFKHRFVLLEILFLMARNPGRPYDKEALARSIWKDEYNPLIHDKLIYTSISRLRKLIEPVQGRMKYILRSKDGYMFNPKANTRFHNEHTPRLERGIGNVDIVSPV